MQIEYNNRMSVITDTNLFTCIQGLGLSEDIVNESLVVYSLFPVDLFKIRRWKTCQLAYLTVSESYKRLRKVPDINKLRKMLKLSENQIKIITKDAARSGYQLTIHKYLPNDFIEQCYHFIGISSDHKPYIIKLVDKLLTLFPKHHESKPQIVAGAIVLYYAEIKGYEVKLKEYLDHFNYKISTIMAIKKNVAVSDQITVKQVIVK